jgi:hypothetical protein
VTLQQLAFLGDHFTEDRLAGYEVAAEIELIELGLL